MYSIEEKRRYVRQLSDFIYKTDLITAAVSAMVILCTNGFWLVIDALDIYNLNYSIPGSRGVVAIVFLACLYMIFLWRFLKSRINLVHYSLLGFCLLICLQVPIYSINKNILVASNAAVIDGISLSTMYLIILVFLSMPNLVEEIIKTVFMIVALVVPGLVAGKAAYSLGQNLIFGCCLVIACYFFRYINWRLAKQNMAFIREKELYRQLTTQSIATIANTIDAKDYYTHGHSRRVGEYARELAVRMGLNKEEQENIYFAGLLHDIGKISVPNEVLNKKGRLTDEEFAIIKKHPLDGYNILKELKVIPMIAQASRWHHERVDGRGYPDGIRGNDLPMYAKIIAVADSYDAMASERPYRTTLSVDFIVNELKQGKGTQFEAAIVDKMLEMIDEKLVPIKLDDSGYHWSEEK